VASADGFSVPSKFVQLLLSDAPGFRELFNTVASSQLPAPAKEDILSKAVLKGLDKANALLQSYLRGFSDGAPRFLREQENAPVVYLTDGRLCFPFYTMDDLEELVEELPINVYCKPEKMLFTLDRKRF